MLDFLKDNKTSSRYCGGEETGENAQILGPPPGGLTARLHAKSETASKVVSSGRVSEVDA
ncbi:hypothetical protein EMIT07CA2_70042 [Brevibacillus sp. IT-7CA2]